MKELALVWTGGGQYYAIVAESNARMDAWAHLR